MKPTRFGLLFLCLLLCFQARVRGETRGFDLMLVLDESGSMKETDPEGARREAARLFLMLCGAQHRVGLMGFATDVRLLAAPEPMAPGAGRELLLERVAAVRSDGKLTDIEKVLRAALDEMPPGATPTGETRGVLLMTDGKVDLGQGVEQDQASLERIRSDVATAFIQAGVQVHCIAFSSRVDRETLEYLSQATGGLCVSGDDDEELQRLFVRLFEELGQPQTAPLRDNQVRLDSAVSEATFLITHAPDAKATRLLTPQGQGLRFVDADRPSTVKWFESPTYDLITVETPEPGVWKIEPNPTSDADRVILLTDVELTLEDFNPCVRSRESMAILASLRSHDQVVQEPEFLARLTMTGSLADSTARSYFNLFDDGQHGDYDAADGIFGGDLVAPAEPGACEIEIIARAPTLERRIVRSLTVVDRWFALQAFREEVVEPDGEVAIKVLVTSEDILHAAGSLEFTTLVQDPQGGQTRLDLAEIGEGEGLFGVLYHATRQTGIYRVSVEGRYRDANGKTLQGAAGPLEFAVEEQVALAPTPTEPPVVAAVAEEERPEPEPQPGKGRNLFVTLLQVAILLVLLSLVALIMVYIIRQGAARTLPGEESMAALRRRAAEIRRAEAQEEGADLPETGAGTPRPQPGPEEPARPDGEETLVETRIDEAAETVLLPEVSEEPVKDVSNEETVVTQVALEDNAEALSSTEQDLLGQILAEVDEGQKASAEASQTMEIPVAEKPAEEESSDKGKPDEELLSSTENDLLDEIMADVDKQVAAASPGSDGDAGNPPAEDEIDSHDEADGEPGEPTPGNQADADLSEAESQLMAEIERDISGIQSEAENAEKDDESSDKKGSSSQDTIDDILRQIEGLVE